MESEDEISNGNYTTHFRALDTRIGRWLSIDPKMKKYAGWSPYNFAFNSPILRNDIRGDEPPPTLNEIRALGQKSNTFIKLAKTAGVEAEDLGRLVVWGRRTVTIPATGII